MSKPFRFKQFVIYQDKSAMKVGTDGVLLGAWANVETAKNILDIGIGTGLLALMCAQRNSNAKITAIEIDQSAFEQAQENIKISPWPERINLIHSSLQTFLKTKQYFDHIICNPPFFVANRHMQEDARKMARQETSLSIHDLAQASELLSKEGLLSFIYPFDRLEEVVSVFQDHQLFLNRKMVVRGRIGIEPKRVLLCFSKQQQTEIEEQELVIEPYKRHEYSDEFRELTKEFYVKSK